MCRYSALDRVVKGRGLATTVRKMCADQGLFMPLYLVVFVGVMGALRGDRPADIGSKLKRDMAPMMKVCLSAWLLRNGPPTRAACRSS